MSIKNLLTDSNKPDQNLKVNSIDTSNLSVDLDFVSTVYGPPAVVNLTSNNTLLTVTNWPVSAPFTTVPITVNHPGINLNEQIIMLTTDSTDISSLPASSDWVANIYSVSSGSFIIHCNYIQNSGSSSNTVLKLYILIIPIPS